MMDYMNILGTTAAAMGRAAQRVMGHIADDGQASAYLNGATSIADLEMRMRELDGPRRGLIAHPTNFSTPNLFTN